MNVEVLGDDITYGADMSWLSSAWNGFTNFVTSDTGKQVTGALLNVAAERLSPTQKAQVSQMQSAAGMQPIIYNYGTPQPVVLPQPGGIKPAIPYIIIGGAVLVGAAIMLGTRKPR